MVGVAGVQDVDVDGAGGAWFGSGFVVVVDVVGAVGDDVVFEDDAAATATATATASSTVAVPVSVEPAPSSPRHTLIPEMRKPSDLLVVWLATLSSRARLSGGASSSQRRAPSLRSRMLGRLNWAVTSSRMMHVGVSSGLPKWAFSGEGRRF